MLQDLEVRFAGNAYHVPPTSLGRLTSPYAVRAASAGLPTVRPNLQHFALDSTTELGNPNLEIVVLIGSNYTEHPNLTDWNVPDFSKKALLTKPPWIEDCISQMKGARTKLDNNLPTALKGVSKCHLVMTNFCPWITIDHWGDLRSTNRKVLLTHPGPQATYHPRGGT
jgi:hypothetical protein